MYSAQYTVLKAYSANDLAELVSARLKLGWRTSGGLQLDKDQNGTVYYQAIEKR